MWKSVCFNRICFDIDKSREQNQHLERLLTIKPTMNSTNRPHIPEFITRRGPQIEKRKQIQEKINYENQLVKTQINEIYTKPGKYCQKPPQKYPAFRRNGSYKYSDLIKQIKIYESNIKFQNKIQTCRPCIDNKDIKKDAENQKKYLYNLLNRPKSIPITPSLKFYSVDQIINKANKFIAQQEYYNSIKSSKNQAKGTSVKRGGSAKKSSNNSKLNKSKKSNKCENKVSKSQSAKKQKNIKIDDDNKNENNKDNLKGDKKETTTKNTTTKC